MSEYFVTGGTYKDLKGEERFDLVGQGPGEPPCVLIESVIAYFGLVWQKAHLYRVGDDYTLTLVAPSQKALQWSVKAPERVWLNANLLERLRAVINPDTPSGTPEENGLDDCLRLTEPMNA